MDQYVKPPEGWFDFGTHVNDPTYLEFSEETDETGLPLWERPKPDPMITGGPEVVYAPIEDVRKIASELAIKWSRTLELLGQGVCDGHCPYRDCPHNQENDD